MRIFRYTELFAGVGGFRLGIERAFRGYSHKGLSGSDDFARDTPRPNSQLSELGVERQLSCVFANEWDNYAAQTYNRNFGGEIDTRSITHISADEIPNHELLVGGFPCQAFSTAGRRLGFNETRGTLFFEIARILRNKRPRYLLLENVKGLLSHDGGKTFKTILGVLADLGYDVEWQVLNSKDFGVPQNRERVFIVGYFGGRSSRKVFPLEGNNRETSEVQEGKKEVAPTVGTGVGKNQSDGAYIIHNIYGGFNREFHNVSPTIRTPQGGGHLPMVVEQTRIRRLTPVECERLQGFPDNWTEGVSDTQRYKQMGNAVTVNVVEAIMCKIFEAEYERSY